MKIIPYWTAAWSALCLAAVSLTLGCAAKSPAAAPNAGAEKATASRASAEPASAEDILFGMARILAEAKKFSVNLQGSYDVVQASGQKIEFGEKRRVIVNRPNGLRVQAEQSDGEKHLVLYDGNDITTYTPNHNVYAQISKQGGVDEAVMYFLRDIKMRLPLAMLLVTKLPEELERRTLALDYVEKTKVHGRKAHHLAGRTDTVDYQVWIADGRRPLPLRVVLTYRYLEGQPQFRAEFSDWNLKPKIRASQFTFKPPKGANKISFAAHLPKIALDGITDTEQTGEQK
ncbi:MAG: DUF2092 domain-containing protein [Gammaproteobacteria bacterium]